jgi:uncharacterized protein (TIGR02996 family)
MSDTRAGLVQAILEQPDDDGLRLIFADWLEDHGEADYAGFIRKQVALARVPEYDPLWVRAWATDPDSITGRGFEKYLPALPPGLFWPDRPFHRGFPARVGVRDKSSPGLEHFAKVATDLFAVAPIRALAYEANYRAPPPSLEPLTNSPHLLRLRELSFRLGRLPAAEIRRLGDSAYAGGLTDLDFSFAGIDNSSVEDRLSAVDHLLLSPLMDRLTGLTVHSNDIPWQELCLAAHFAGGPYRLRRLVFSETTTAPTQYYQLFDLPLLRSVVELDLSYHQLGQAGFEALAASRLAPGLESLTLERTHPGVPGVQALAGAPLSNLLRLVLANNRLGPIAVRHLAISPHLNGLRSLDLSYNPIGDRGIAALVEAPFYPNLMHLDLSRCDIGDAGAAALLAAPRPAGLVCLDLSLHDPRHQVGEGLKKRLVERFGPQVAV